MGQFKVNYGAIVVGGGVSGLLCALALAREGKKILLIEKNIFLGGNCRTYKINGYSVDTGPHAITELVNGPLVKLMDKYFSIKPKFIPINSYYARDGKKLQEIPLTLPQFAQFNILSRSDRILMIGAMMDAIAFSSIDKRVLDKSIFDYIKKYGMSHKALRLVDAISYFLSGKSMKETPMWRILSGSGYASAGNGNNHIEKIMKLLKNDYSAQGYPANGIQSITDCVLKSIPEGAVTFKLNEMVVKFTTDGNRIEGVETNIGTYGADMVVYSGFVNDLASFTVRLNEDYKNNLKKISQSRSVTLWLGLKKRMEDFSYLGSEVYFNTETPYWAMPVSNFDSGLAPKEKQLIGFSTVIKEDTAEKQVKKLKRTIFRAVPEIEGNIELEHVQTTIPEKGAITVGVKFPSPKSPLENLYLVGTDTDTRSMGITRAAYSVVEALKFMKQDGKI